MTFEFVLQGWLRNWHRQALRGSVLFNEDGWQWIGEPGVPFTALTFPA